MVTPQVRCLKELVNLATSSVPHPCHAPFWPSPHNLLQFAERFLSTAVSYSAVPAPATCHAPCLDRRGQLALLLPLLNYEK